MSGADWYEISFVAFSSAVEGFALILTLASAYLIAAYSVGSKLTRTQVSLVNLIFVPAMLFFGMTILGGLADSQQARVMAAGLISELGAASPVVLRFINYLVVVLILGLLLICIKFMRDVRRSDKGIQDG